MDYLLIAKPVLTINHLGIRRDYAHLLSCCWLLVVPIEDHQLCFLKTRGSESEICETDIQGGLMVFRSIVCLCAETFRECTIRLFLE